MRIGFGYDVHRLVTGRPLVLGGVRIPYDKGLMGHSDADVLVHAVCDALLGAAGLGDLGTQFPDNDPAFKGIYSIELLKRCREMLTAKGYRLVSIDATIMAEAPKLNPFRREMESTLADALDIEAACVNVKATTTEGLGYIGTGEGIAANCAALIVAA